MAYPDTSFLWFLLCCWIAVHGATPPSIYTVSKDQNSVEREGGTAILHCQASSDIPVTYSWSSVDFNGNEKDMSLSQYNQDRSTGQLTISNLQHSQDDGYYHCVAKNAVGGVRSSRLEIRVAYLETHQASDSTPSAIQHGKFVFTYAVPQSHPEPKITWRKSGSLLSETDRIMFSKLGNLYIGNVQINDLGVYTSLVENTITSQSYNRGQVSLRVTATASSNVRSEIILAPTHQVAIDGQTPSVTFECFGSGSPMPSITWKKSGQVISSNSKFQFARNKRRLTVVTPTKADEGIYECHVSNPKSAQAGTKKANLTIVVEPKFTAQPSTMEKFPLESVTFPCTASGTPPPQITWFHNGEHVLPSGTGRIQINSASELKITSLRSDDKGKIQCIATNEGGQKISTVTLTVKDLQVWIDIPPKNTIAQINETVELECEGRGNPQPTITWKKNSQGIDFARQPRYFQKSSGSLQISHSQKSDSGEYVCEASNSHGKTTANATLRVLIKTRIIVPMPGQIRAIKAWKKLLPCGVQKDPTVSVQWHWTKDGAPVDGSRMKVLSNGSLEIITVLEKDAGTYVCQVKSVAGNDTTTGTLVVQETPLAPLTPSVSDIQPTSVRLSWDPPGYDGNSPIISYVVEAKEDSDDWKQHVDNINPSDRRMSIIVRNLKPHTQYQFRVRAINQVGVGAASGASGSVRTLIAAPSAPPENVIGVPTAADSILVQWKVPPPDTHNGPLRGFKVAYRLAGVVGSSFIVKKIESPAATQGNIDGLVQWTRYEMKVLAYNDAGDGQYSQPITVTTAEGVPTASPLEIKVINITTTSVELEWKPPPQKQQNGVLRGYKLQAWKSTPNDKVQRIANHDDTKVIQTGILGGLEKFTQYTVVIIAFNSAGDSPQSDKLLIKTVEGVPDAPASLTVSEVYSDALRVSWGRPTRINGVLIAYIVKHWENSSLPSTGTTQHLSNTTLSHTITRLRATTPYSVQVSAETRAGVGTSSRLVAMTTSSPVLPGAPHNLRVIEARARSVLLTWTPGSSGRAPILSYTIEYNNDSFYDPQSARWRTLTVVQDAHLVWNLLPLEVRNLRPYTDYRFRIIATNKVGSSSPSNASDTVKTLQTAPSLPPSDLTLVQFGKDGLELRWKIPPRDSWNGDFIGYSLKFEPQGVPSHHTLQAKVPNSQLNYYTAGGLLKYKHYKVSVRTYNLNSGEESNTSAVAWAWTKEDAPDLAPTSLTPTVSGSTSIYLEWRPVPDVGKNGVIIGYKIYYRVVGRSISEKEKEITGGQIFSTTLSNLESFVTYEIQILAYTRIGPGPRSPAVRATTLESTPGTPAHVRFTDVGERHVIVAWDPPVYPRGEITGYQVAYRRNSSSSGFLWQDSAIGRTKRTRLVANIIPRTFYRFFVWAKTKIGWSSRPAEAVVFTSASAAEPPDTPFVLPIPYSNIGERWITVRWQATSRPQSPLRYFTLQVNKNGQGWQVYSSNVPHSSRSLKVEGLIPGETYTFRIMATNDRGNSPYSVPSRAVSTRLALPTGAPRNVRIQARSPTSLLIEWEAPLPQELGGTLKGFIVKYKEEDAVDAPFTEVNLTANSRQLTIDNLQVFTVYQVKVAALNEKGPGPYTPLYLGTTGERSPSEPPKDVQLGKFTRTSIAISWKAPPADSFNGDLMGYKVYAEDQSLAETRKRRRRRSLPLCPREPGPKLMFVPPHKTSANVTNLRNFVTYKIWVRAYNSKGESPPSAAVQQKTLPDKPGPPAMFNPDAVYNERVDLFWEPPCEPNGEITEYELKYGRTSTIVKQDRSLGPDRRSYIVTSLDMETSYSFQLRARNEMGYGPPMTFVVKTKGPAVLPGKPGKPVVHPGAITAVVMWENGDSGNIPFEKFEIQSRTSDNGFETHWEASPDDTRRNRTYVYYTVGNLEPETSYQFRIISWNAVGASPPSNPSDTVFTGAGDTGASSGEPVYKKVWFIILMVCFAVIFILLIIGFSYICYRRRKNAQEDRESSTGVSTVHSTLEILRTNSRSGTIRNGTIPGVQVTYRDSEQDEDMNSVGSKEELSDSDSGVSELTYKRKADLTFVNHYNNDPSWRTSLGRQRPTRDRNLIEHTTEESDVPDDGPAPRALKSFSVMSLNRVDKPPAYDGRQYMTKSADHLDRIQRSELPPEAVTSFMSPGYEQRQKRPALLDFVPNPHSRTRAARPQGALRRSRDQLDDGDDSSTPPHSPVRSVVEGFSYAPKGDPQNRNRREPRRGSFRKALELAPPDRDSDGSSRYSDRGSSSSSDHRDTRPLEEPSNFPRIHYDEEPGGRRRQKPPNLLQPAAPRYMPSSPSTPISPAPSYHTVDPVYANTPAAGRIFPAHSYLASSREPLDDFRGEEPRVMYLDGPQRYDNRDYQSSEPHISNYSSFV